MKTLKLKISSSIKLLKNEKELSAKDVEEVSKSITPGEWVLIIDESQKRKYLSYINPHSESFFNIKVLKHFPIEFIPQKTESEIALDAIRELISVALKRRSLFVNYSNGMRLIYGNADSLPGLIVDMYKKNILIQINTAGLDRFRNEIKKIFSESFPTKQSILFDNLEYRKFETLPTYESEEIDSELEVVENEISYKINKKSLQKIGFYYDHRENRLKLLRKIQELSINKNTGLDLFSYVGSWGLHLLKAGIKNVEFVDQGDMQNSINENLLINGFEGRGSFVRKDVFKYLDELISIEKKYDVVVSDPPAFAKSEKNKHTAIQGYEKLHFKSLKLVNDNGLFVAASCTHYVDHEELDKTVQDAAFRNGLKIQMLDIGIQGYDHPMSGLRDKSCYIKYLLYLVHKG